MPGRNVNLTEHLNGFVSAQVSSGRHQNASEVVREALRRYEDTLAAERERVKAIRVLGYERAADGCVDILRLIPDMIPAEIAVARFVPDR